MNLAPAIIDEALGVEVYYEDDRTAKAFAGKRAKPDFYIRFGGTERRDAYVAQWLANLRASVERKAKAKADRTAWQHNVKVGDIFVASWGYEQTNIDYYQVVAVRGRVVETLAIGKQADAQGFMQGHCVPAPDAFLTVPDYESDESKAHHERTGRYLSKVPAPRRFVPQPGYQGDAVLKVASYAHASLKKFRVVGGMRVFEPDHWTGYA
jgi:hypothetical protein